MPVDAALAERLGAKALIIFAIALPLLLLGVACVWWLAGHPRLKGAASRLTPQAFLAVRLGLGFGFVVAAGLVFAEIAEHVGADRGLDAIDRAFSGAIGRAVPRPVVQAFAGLTHLGDTVTLTTLCVLVGAALVLAGRRWMAFAWVLAIGGNAVLNTSLKSVFERVRPLRDHGLATASGWSFPSGHTSGSVVAYGMLAYVLIRVLPPRWHLPLVLLAAALAFSIGWSRVFLQVHFASDVLAGFISGSAWLAVCIVGCELTLHRRRTLPGRA